MDSNNQNNTNAIAGAITFPTRSNDDVQPAPVQPRQPRNLQGLLRFAMEATKAEDAPGNSEFHPMDDERRRFLEEALKSMTVNLADILQNAIKELSDQEKIGSIQLGQQIPSETQAAFMNLLEYIGDIDVSNDFYKMGGFSIFPICFGSENDGIRAQACGILAELCQNNNYCQKRALECGLLNILLTLVQSERGNALAKCLYALSCICREYDPACRELLAQGGCETLAQLVGAPEPTVRTKAAFLIRYFCQHYSEAREQLINMGIVRIITEQIRRGRDHTTEHLLSTLLALAEGRPPAVLRQCRHPGLAMRELLEANLQLPELKGERFREERDYTQEMLKQVFADYPRVETLDEEIADR